MSRTLTKFAKNEIRTIHNYSATYNKNSKKEHSKILLKLMSEHVDEIAHRHNKKDRHYITETGDLIILCLELIREARASADTVLAKCYKRYHEKFSQLLNNTEKDR